MRAANEFAERAAKIDAAKGRSKFEAPTSFLEFEKQGKNYSPTLHNLRVFVANQAEIVEEDPQIVPDRGNFKYHNKRTSFRIYT